MKNNEFSTAIINSGMITAQTFQKENREIQLSSLITLSQVPGVAVAAVGSAGRLFSHSFGTTAGGEPVTSDTLHPICSLSKAFTCALLAIATDRGLFDWEKPLKTFIPTFELSDPMATELLTGLDFASHRTGLAVHDPLWYAFPLSPKRAVDCLPFMQFAHPIRTAFEYNNNAYKVLARVVELVFAKPFSEVLQEEILDPLGMVATTLDSTQLPNRGMRPHEPKVNRKEGYNSMHFYSESEHDACGDTGICTTINDYVRWLQFILNEGIIPENNDCKRLISTKEFSRLFIPVSIDYSYGLLEKAIEHSGPLNYALGWWIGSYRNEPYYMHSGWNDGFISLVKILPESKVAAVAFFNVDTNPFDEAIVHSVLDMGLSAVYLSKPTISPSEWAGRFEQKAKRWTNFKPPPSPKFDRLESPYDLNEYVGVYNHALYGTLSISLKDGHLVGTRGNVHDSVLVFAGSENESIERFKMKRIRWIDTMTFKRTESHVSAVSVFFGEWNEEFNNNFIRV
ncbi:hypothetical protein HK100_000658 [Physocladia obscura]|uniref:Beta-lactamase-related domain-containing protein n=1 Tax=Physocladia obscura TaxID=109957 RepID=A0AAD5SYA7_9FUNG|nr:hypothetical protein HK100_000658 [Physocladia obscura]